MLDKTLWIFLGLEVLFLISGALLIAIAILFDGKYIEGPMDIATNLLLNNFSLRAAIVNGVLVFVTAIVSGPALLNSKDRKWLRIHAYMVLICGALSLIAGLLIWFFTLRTRRNLLSIYESQTPAIQSALQMELSCCGYLDANTPPFIKDNICTNSFIAARLGPCIAPFSAFANSLLDTVFTGLFGLVAIDGLLFLSTCVMIKKRDESERYIIIDRKYGSGGI